MHKYEQLWPSFDENLKAPDVYPCGLFNQYCKLACFSQYIIAQVVHRFLALKLACLLLVSQRLNAYRVVALFLFLKIVKESHCLNVNKRFDSPFIFVCLRICQPVARDELLLMCIT